MQKRIIQQLSALAFSVLPWAIYHFLQWRWTTHGAHFQPSMNEHLAALWALSFGIVCSILSLALSMRKPRNSRSTLFSIVLLASCAWYCAETVPLIADGFRARWSLGSLV
jgi:hypothetical protein